MARSTILSDTRFCSDSNITCFCEESGSLSKVANRPLQFFKVGSSPWSSILALHVFEFTLVDSERIKFFDPKWFPWFQCWELSIFRWSDGQGYCVTVRNKYLNSGFARGSVGTRTYLHDPNDPYLHLQDPPGIHWSGDPYTTFFWGTHGNPRNIWRSVNYHVCKLPRGGWKHDATCPTCRIIPVPSPPKSWVQGLEEHLWWCGCGAAGAKVLVRAQASSDSLDLGPSETLYKITIGWLSRPSTTIGLHGSWDQTNVIYIALLSILKKI